MTAGAAGYHDSFLTTYHQGKPSKRLRMAILQSPDADSRQLPSAKDPLKVFSFAAGGEIRRLGVFQNRLLELHSLQTGPAENPGSWFVGESVCSTGPLAAATLLDPLFVLLPMLEATHRKEPAAFRLFDQVLSEHAAAVAAQFKLPDSSFEQRHDTKAWPQVFRSLAPSFEAECLPLVCDSQRFGSATTWRLNETRVKQWLCCKVESLVAFFTASPHIIVSQQRGQHVSALHAGALAPALERRVLVREAIALLRDAVDESWVKALLDIYRVQEERRSTHAQFESNNSSSPFGARTAATPAEAKDAAPPMKKTSTSTKQLEKAAQATMKGSRPITSFFQPAPKK